MVKLGKFCVLCDMLSGNWDAISFTSDQWFPSWAKKAFLSWNIIRKLKMYTCKFQIRYMWYKKEQALQKNKASAEVPNKTMKRTQHKDYEQNTANWKTDYTEGKPLADNIQQATWQREFKHVPESTLSFFLPSPSAWPLNLCVIASLCGTSHTMTFWFLLCRTYFYRVWHYGSRDCKLSAPWRLLTWSVGGEEAGESQDQRKKETKISRTFGLGGAFAIFFLLTV